VFHRTLQETGPPSTFVRLLTSNHLNDLQWIGHCAVALSALWIWAVFNVKGDAVDLDDSLSAFMRVIVDQNTTLGGVTAALGVVLAWVYQTGSKRLGVVDLFACEISAICRVSLVIDHATRSVDQAALENPIVVAETPAPVEETVATGAARPEHGPTVADAPGWPSSANPAAVIPTSPMKFTSEEHYTPVYDGTLSDLQPLSVTTVTFVTEFYTYRKAMMDYLRRIAAEKKAGEKRSELWKMLIYMQYLMYESGRHAITELVEFEPNREESLINILCSELVVFDFLKDRYPPKDYSHPDRAGDYRGNRLQLRQVTYPKIVENTLGKAINARQHRNWDRARATAPELKLRYEKIFGTEHNFAERAPSPSWWHVLRFHPQRRARG
jgi:hypothetical protein